MGTEPHSLVLTCCHLVLIGFFCGAGLGDRLCLIDPDNSAVTFSTECYWLSHLKAFWEPGLVQCLH